MFTNKIKFSLLSIRTALTAVSLMTLPLLAASYASAEGAAPPAPRAAAGTNCRLLSGFQFTTPANWRTEAVENVVRIRPNSAAENEIYALSTDVMEGVNSVTSPKLAAAVDAETQKFLPSLKRVGSPTSFKTECGPAVAFSYRNQGQVDCDGLLLLTFVKSRAVFLLALAPSARIAAEQKSLITLFSSLTTVAEAAPTANSAAIDKSPLGQQWNTRLRNKKLVYLSSYSSGLSGGTSSQKELRLLADGRFTYTSSSSVSISVDGANGNSSGRQAGQGTWNIVVRNNTAYLSMTENGKKAEVPLQFRDGKTFLNGVRFFVTNL